MPRLGQCDEKIQGSNDLSHDGHFCLVEKAELPAEGADDIARLQEDKGVRGLFGG